MSQWRSSRAVHLAQFLLAAVAVTLCAVPTLFRVPDRLYTEAGGGVWVSFRGYPVPWVEHRQEFTWRPNERWGVTDVRLGTRACVGWNPVVPAALLAVAVCLPPVAAAVGADLARRVRRRPSAPTARRTRVAGVVLLGAAAALTVAGLELEATYRTGYTPWSLRWPGSRLGNTEVHKDAAGYARRGVAWANGQRAVQPGDAWWDWAPRTRLTLAAFLAAAGAGCALSRPWRRGDGTGDPADG